MSDQSIFHAVRLIQDKCKGCVNCIKHCPTEAIRVRGGKAEILEARCIDCGECIRVCPNHAKTAVADSLEHIKAYPIRIALPAPALFGQFDESVSPEQVLEGLIELGFDDVFEVAHGADLVTIMVRKEIAKDGIDRPLISSSCPAVVRLIQVRFPGLIDHIVPVSSPIRVASRLARKAAAKRFHVDENQVGLFFLSPCPGKVTAIRNPVGYDTRSIDGAIPIADIFGPLSKAIHELRSGSSSRAKMRATGLGIGWARAGGENQAVALGRQISVDGIHNLLDIFEDIEKGKLSNIDYIEALACVGGCVGGVLNVENPFIARRRIRLIAEDMSIGRQSRKAARVRELAESLDDSVFRFERSIQPRSSLALSSDMQEAIHKMERLDLILEELPGLDCGSCGAPTCQALAEDIVRDEAVETDCVFVLRQRVKGLSDELVSLSSKLPPAMQQGDQKPQPVLERLLSWRDD